MKHLHDLYPSNSNYEAELKRVKEKENKYSKHIAKLEDEPVLVRFYLFRQLPSQIGGGGRKRKGLRSSTKMKPMMRKLGHWLSRKKDSTLNLRIWTIFNDAVFVIYVFDEMH